MNTVRGESEKTLDEPDEGIRTPKPKAKRMNDDDIDDLPIWVY
ncbi:MAG: hypothetical protein ACFFEU_01310 [Candidatus Thorarchaeota archaeon]|jgi:hypothetical protein